MPGVGGQLRAAGAELLAGSVVAAGAAAVDPAAVRVRSHDDLRDGAVGFQHQPARAATTPRPPAPSPQVSGPAGAAPFKGCRQPVAAPTRRIDWSTLVVAQDAAVDLERHDHPEQPRCADTAGPAGAPLAVCKRHRRPVFSHERTTAVDKTRPHQEKLYNACEASERARQAAQTIVGMIPGAPAWLGYALEAAIYAAYVAWGWTK